jgi:hypothetical protein
MNKMRITTLVIFLLIAGACLAGDYEVSSPNGKVKVTVNTDEAVKWAIDYEGKQVLLPSEIDILVVQGKKALDLGKVGKVATSIVNILSLYESIAGNTQLLVPTIAALYFLNVILWSCHAPPNCPARFSYLFKPGYP